ncbi:M3 family peptidase [bacterium M00.F.Ca.ET.228.01.1.1]|uniref:oligopeptidase A n=1 Tax=Burkholderia sp. (strain CCGE1003) TaxID=640512 RepID=E1T3H9_BURSG|nr:M3 family metallopeptidase [Paraburkholderia phenoliruptrix]MBW9128353.1 M3 family metallopeptidase [Paraburkholderia ginsengiterrae]TGP41659.1 M3 family peptidase [bacterium M00.F.Ca.ET.228.01.1.1]TGR98450.1 M3 family peptidase [bacterium M00.F.Ca.ET.191.01.1.1]TGU02784.1 M3 family peptidase [bacterium M00.F.Ca.ET.155.01.1.1]MBW9103796.1 M3 family metallopeptidase [Paraburkholderia phenoliruptrix]
MSTTVSNHDNPLLDFSDLPRFGEIRPEHVTPALDVLLADAAAAVERAAAPITPASWADVVEPVERATEPLSRAWSIVGHLNAVADTPELRAVYGENLPRVTEFWSSVGQNLALYEKYKALNASDEFASLTSERKKILANALRDFRLSGAELPEDQKPRFAELQERQAALSKAFSDHVLDATNAYAYFVEAGNGAEQAELAGLPEDVIEAAKEAAEREGKTGYKFTLHFPSYFPVMQYSENRPMREAMYRAYVTRASELGPQYGNGKPEWDNTSVLAEQLKLRAEEAQMLGYRNFAEVSLAPKMAESPEQVMAFLEDLATRARPHAEQDWKELREFAAGELGLADLQPWDMTFAAERLRQKRYSFSENEVKQYFPEDAVFKGLFKVTETLFGVRIRRDEAAVWHPDVRFFRVENQDGGLVAQFYLDLYAREGKRGGAWMDDARGRHKHTHGGVQTPVAYLTCNFSAPVGGKPACFTHDEVITLFHEFGHGLHHMLTRVDELGVSGINGVEWDAVELPSQFMENFCWEWDVLSDMTSHVETAKPLPRELFDKMLAAKNFQSGLGTLRQIVFSMFDMQLHTGFDASGAKNATQLASEINERFHVVPQAPFSRWPNTFSHIFAGGYAAGYYSYKWAEVLSADAYAAFEEAAQSASGSVLDQTTGMRYRKEILEVGGSRPAMESFKAFRGREPNIDALLRHNGMAPSATH